MCVAGDDAVVAAAAGWAMRDAVGVHATLSWLKKHPGQKRRAEICFHEELRAHGWITASDPPRLTREGSNALEVLTRTIGADRTSETVRFLHQNATIDSSSRVLDVGCSAGHILRSLAARRPLRAVGVDQDLFALHVAALGWSGLLSAREPEWWWANAVRLPFGDGEFTHGLSFATLNYLPVRASLRELARVIQPGGQLIASVEGEGVWRHRWRLSDSLRRIHLMRERLGGAALLHADWQRIPALRRLSQRIYFSMAALKQLLPKAGFAVERCEALWEEQGAPWAIGIAARRK
ncbi:class I SAM-dependent methyltransferase [Sorangium sp. So ce726]|uniref:class I SAM-dependent methyltransferase n=1 Tax=Sorangium sp. So ce726 TaxID=3133319 RepID=UPI003F63A38C